MPEPVGVMAVVALSTMALPKAIDTTKFPLIVVKASGTVVPLTLVNAFVLPGAAQEAALGVPAALVVLQVVEPVNADKKFTVAELSSKTFPREKLKLPTEDPPVPLTRPNRRGPPLNSGCRN